MVTGTEGMTRVDSVARTTTVAVSAAVTMPVAATTAELVRVSAVLRWLTSARGGVPRGW